MSGKRKCPFADTSPQQLKTHVTMKQAARMNEDLMKQMMDRTRSLLLDGQQKYWNKENQVRVEVVSTGELTCYTCTNKAASKACTHCTRYFCSPCARVCDGCCEVFCTLCSVLNYEQATDRAFCLSCAP